MLEPIIHQFDPHQPARWQRPENKSDHDFRSRWKRKARRVAEEEGCTFRIVAPNGSVLHEEDPPNPWHGRL